MPTCSPTKSRSLPGQRAISKGFLNLRFGNARTTLKGGGGSGEPTTREVVQGTRTGLAGATRLSAGGPAAKQASKPTSPTRGASADTTTSRRLPGEGDDMIHSERCSGNASPGWRPTALIV